MKLKNKILKTICLFLASTFVLSACTEKEVKSSGQLEYSEAKTYEYGVHSFDKSLTSDYLVQNGKSDYVILIPDGIDATISNAANELQALFYEATGATLNIVSDSQVDNAAKVISLGNTQKAATNKISVDDLGLNTHGYIIKTVDESVYIKDGGSSFGVH